MGKTVFHGFHHIFINGICMRYGRQYATSVQYITKLKCPRKFGSNTPPDDILAPVQYLHVFFGGRVAQIARILCSPEGIGKVRAFQV
jgi:hypothetical protein